MYIHHVGDGLMSIKTSKKAVLFAALFAVTPLSIPALAHDELAYHSDEDHYSFAMEGHSHYGFTQENHSHSGFAEEDHSHYGFAQESHGHSGFAEEDHTHHDVARLKTRIDELEETVKNLVDLLESMGRAAHSL